MFKNLLRFLILLFFTIAVVVPWQNYFENKVKLSDILASPSGQHLLGTDNLGRDLFLRLLSAIKDVVLPLWGITIFFTALGIYASILMRSSFRNRSVKIWQIFIENFAGLVLSIPIGITVFCFAVLFEINGIVTVAFTLAMIFFLKSFLMIRDLFQTSSKLGYWQSHEALGGSSYSRQIRYGVMRDWRQPITESIVTNCQIAIILEASLSYLGFGVSEPNPSLGNMIASHFDMAFRGDFYVLFFITLTLLLCMTIPGLLLGSRE